MHLRIVLRFTSILIFFLGLFMAVPLVVSLGYRDGSSEAFALSMATSFLVGLVLFLFTRSRQEVVLNHRDGVAIVTLGWIMAGLFGMLPYIASGSIPDFTNAYFESLSGFTTTGASILTDIESLPKGVLLWRSLTQWIGGMGIIVLSIAILPFLGVGGMQLYRAETPSPVVDKLKPRISDTAKILWKVYVAITIVQVIFLLGGGMSVFDAFCHAFCTLPTGGFSTKNASILAYNSAYLDTVIIVFMLLAGINFSLHYKMLKGDRKIFGRDEECRVFLVVVAVFTLLITLDTYGGVYTSFFHAFRQAAFQVSSIITTTGFVSADYEKWPAFSQIILLICMFFGAMAGSTGGGMKFMRIILLIKHGYQQIIRIIHPHAVTSVKLGGRAVPTEVLNGIWGFFILYLCLFLIATLVMAALGLDFVSSIGAVASSLGNVGPGLGMVGPVRNYLEVPLAGKWVLVACMLIGRLEIYTVIVLLAPEFWRK
ncbi:MAG TPA: TrkH family potassium uptake protein [Deltaproteobacteria bacterium]|nr:TrkH family potassium uptake protein [Deltaproteobacteria bacterium]